MLMSFFLFLLIHFLNKSSPILQIMVYISIVEIGVVLKLRYVFFLSKVLFYLLISIFLINTFLLKYIS